MVEPLGERLAALEAAFREFKHGITKSVEQGLQGVRETIAEKAKHTSAVIGSLEKLLWWAIGGGIAAIVSLWGGIYVLDKQIEGVENRLIAIETTTKDINTKVQSIPDEVAELKSVSGSMLSVAVTLQNAIKNIPAAPPSRGESPGTLNILVFDEKQQALIREAFPKVAGVVTPLADKYELGAFVNDPELLKALAPPPDFAVKQVPQLEGTQFAVGTIRIVFVRSSDDRVVALVSR